MSPIESIILETPEPEAARAFYDAAFGLDARVRVASSSEPTTGFRGFAVSLVVSQPGDVDSLAGTAVAGGATVLKPVAKSFWGYGGVLRDPFGVIWKLASESKKNTGPTTREISDVVLLLGVTDVAVSKRFYVERGLTVAKSFGRKYVEFATEPVRLAFYSRRAAAKDAGVAPEGTGSHRVTVAGGAGDFTDPDGFAWRAATAATAH
ncbi:hypothetical protein Afil01_47560 [Actinorhabdospora filicis]|uniref:Glyoxalase n=1 Tax=Actinorhabdospora filicis TaxID=1785913 RepID=A0A9W6SN40_9ACTN|nr:glyoxalase [Actinorhabdospora filicis]GLZ79949.1 hypothetical protein Afil01_47560 [Actinorhabdospora filicis]